MEKSESIKEIGKAIALFQMKVDKVKKDAKNPFFKSNYASLPNVLEAIRTALEETELCFSQHPNNGALTTILIHYPSGEYLQSSYDLNPVKNDPQGIGSAITYARRYALGSILGLNIDDDDDGNTATGLQSKPFNPLSETKGLNKKAKLTEDQFEKSLTGNAKQIDNVINKFDLSKVQLESLEKQRNLLKMDQEREEFLKDLHG